MSWSVTTLPSPCFYKHPNICLVSVKKKEVRITFSILSWGPLPSFHTHALTVTHAYTLSHTFCLTLPFPSISFSPSIPSYSHCQDMKMECESCTNPCVGFAWGLSAVNADLMKGLSVSKQTPVSSNDTGRLEGWVLLEGFYPKPSRCLWLKTNYNEKRYNLNTTVRAKKSN